MAVWRQVHHEVTQLAGVLIGFGTLILLIGLLGFGAMRRSQALHNATESAHDAYLQTDAVLREIPSDLYLGDILIRDYLLDPSHLRAPAYREQLLARRSSIRQRLDLLAQRLGEGEAAAIADRTPRVLGIDGPNPELLPGAEGGA